MHAHTCTAIMINQQKHVYIPPYTEVSLDKCSRGGDRLYLFLGLCIAYVSLQNKVSLKLDKKKL